MKMLTFDELGFEREALKAKISSNSYIDNSRGSFKLYYASIRTAGDDYRSSWTIGTGDIALILGTTKEAYETAVVEYGGQPREGVCVVNFFEEESDCQFFIDEFVNPLLLARKLSMPDFLILKRAI